MDHKTLSDKQIAARLRSAALRGTLPKHYCTQQGWDFQAVYYRLNKAGLWAGVMAAKYTRPAIQQREVS